jgi:hypothetical protein
MGIDFVDDRRRQRSRRKCTAVGYSPIKNSWQSCQNQKRQRETSAAFDLCHQLFSLRDELFDKVILFQIKAQQFRSTVLERLIPIRYIA